MSFIHGTLPKPASGSPDMENWLTVNSMIVGWIRSSIEPKVRSTVSYITDAHLLWTELKERFSVGNKVRIHQIKSQLASCKQDGQTVLEYYGRLAMLWKELQTYQPVISCSCGAAGVLAKEKEEEKLHQFVMGLDDARFGGLCTSIVASDPLPSLGEVYAKIVREEQRLTSAKAREQQQEAIGFVARREEVLAPVRPSQTETRSDSANSKQEYSGGRGRGGGRNGYNNPGRGRGQANAAHATSSNASSFPEFTADQWKALSKLIQEKSGEANPDKLSGKNTSVMLF
ncbi:unnamed protein product [Microthlaspi erraticum]|uniref:Uncharacterized protein n=1 Tax=Microthlaspi erraticum TaxID=1685480 RepID=A0A6D2JLR7_9BRAS|nr:unnamed protein product [Microthlaspi erraticum]